MSKAVQTPSFSMGGSFLDFFFCKHFIIFLIRGFSLKDRAFSVGPLIMASLPPCTCVGDDAGVPERRLNPWYGYLTSPYVVMLIIYCRKNSRVVPSSQRSFVMKARSQKVYPSLPPFPPFPSLPSLSLLSHPSLASTNCETGAYYSCARTAGVAQGCARTTIAQGRARTTTAQGCVRKIAARAIR